MRQTMLIAAAALALLTAASAGAQHRGGGHRDGAGASAGRTIGDGGARAWHGDAGATRWQGGRGEWQGNPWRDGGGHGGFYRNSGWRGHHDVGRAAYFGSFGFFLGAPYFWWPDAYYPSYYPAYGYPDASYGPVGMDGPVEAPPLTFQYYCPEQGYYPAVATCPRGWVRITPERVRRTE